MILPHVWTYRAWSCALLTAGLLAASGSLRAEPAPAAPPAAATTAAAEAAWWAAFEDEALDTLMAPLRQGSGVGDRQAALTLQADAVAAYVQLRVRTVRLNTARLHQQLAERQLTLLRAEVQPDPARVLAAEALLQETSARAAGLQRERLDSVAALARKLRAAQPLAPLAPLLQVASEETRLPVPRFDLAAELPGLVLRRRADVAQAEAALLVPARSSETERLAVTQYLQAMALPIQASAQAPGLRLWPARDYATVVQRARQEVAWRLWQVGTRTRTAREWHASVTARDAAWQQARTALGAGQLGELEALDAMHALLLAEDQLALASQGLAQAWIALQTGIGGVGRTELGQLLEDAPDTD